MISQIFERSKKRNKLLSDNSYAAISELAVAQVGHKGHVSDIRQDIFSALLLVQEQVRLAEDIFRAKFGARAISM